MKITIEFKPQYLWIGVFWKRQPFPQVQWENTGDPFRAPVLDCAQYDAWICLLPCVPIHAQWTKAVQK